MKNVGTCLWFRDRAEEAAAYYAEVFDDAVVGVPFRASTDEDAPGIEAGGVIVSEVTIAGHRLHLLNGGDHFTLTPAVSIEVRCDDQAEADRYRDRLVGDGGEEDWCGWLIDRYGVSWQVYPERLLALLTDPDPARAACAMAAMRTMHRIDIAAIESAMDASGGT